MMKLVTSTPADLDYANDSSMVFTCQLPFNTSSLREPLDLIKLNFNRVPNRLLTYQSQVFEIKLITTQSSIIVFGYRTKLVRGLCGVYISRERKKKSFKR